MLINNKINASSFCSLKLTYNFENTFSYVWTDFGKSQTTHAIRNGNIPFNLYTVSASSFENAIPPKKAPETVPKALPIQLLDCITPSFSFVSIFLTSSTVIESVATSAKQSKNEIKTKEAKSK